MIDKMVATHDNTECFQSVPSYPSFQPRSFRSCPSGTFVPTPTFVQVELNERSASASGERFMSLRLLVHGGYKLAIRVVVPLLLLLTQHLHCHHSTPHIAHTLN